MSPYQWELHVNAICTEERTTLFRPTTTEGQAISNVATLRRGVSQGCKSGAGSSINLESSSFVFSVLETLFLKVKSEHLHHPSIWVDRAQSNPNTRIAAEPSNLASSADGGK